MNSGVPTTTPDCVSPRFIDVQLFDQAKVRQLGRSRRRAQDVVRLDIAMHDDPGLVRRRRAHYSTA
jgi:hypothetical protein